MTTTRDRLQRIDVHPTTTETQRNRAGAPRQRSATGQGDGECVEQVLLQAQGLTGEARQRLLDRAVVSQLSLARGVAARYRDRGEPLEDLVQIANMALVLAVQRYRPGEGVSFAAYAVPTITGELRRYFRDRGWDVRPPRRIQELRLRVQAATQALTQDLGRTPTSAQIAERLGVPESEVIETLAATEGYHSLSLDTPSADGTGALVDTIGDADERLDHLLDLRTVRPLLAALSERDRHILCLRFYRGCTQQQIAREIGVTQMQVSRLITQALGRLRAAASAG